LGLKHFSEKNALFSEKNFVPLYVAYELLISALHKVQTVFFKNLAAGFDSDAKSVLYIMVLGF